MKFDMEKHHRRSIRLREYDYSHAGVYFVTICVKNRECLFGEIIDGVIHSNEACDMIVAEWSDLLNRFSNIDLDEFVVMPNHLHGLLVLFGRGESCIRPDKNITIEEGDHKDRPYGTLSESIGRVIQAFKSITTHRYIEGVTAGWPPFPGKLWQRNYYERIVRNEKELDKIREYIVNNPGKWAEDVENPNAVNVDNIDPWLLSKK